MKNSINRSARLGGILYLIIIVAGLFGELFVRGKLVVSGDATATANLIIASPSLWRMGIAGDLIMHLCDIPLMLIFFILLRPVNKNLALLAVLFNLVQSVVLVVNISNLFTPLFLLANSDYLKVFEPQQLHALVYVAIKSNAYGFGNGLLFFGFACLLFGYLIFRSGYLPKALGVLMQIAGLCYIVNSFALILSPKLAGILSPAILVPVFIAELSFCLWLLIKGLNITEWDKRERLRTATAASPEI